MMISGIVDAVLRPYRSARWGPFDPNHVFLVSYPKSGNTWLRQIVSNYITLRKSGRGITGISDIDLYCPDIYKTRYKDMVKNLNAVCLKSHDTFNFRYKKVVYIVRDPRDVCVSYMYYWQRIGAYVEVKEDESWRMGHVEKFLFEKNNFGPWGWHVGSWLGARGQDEEFVVVKYEEMKEDPLSILKPIMEFCLTQEVDEEMLESAIKLSDISRARRMEREDARWKEQRDIKGSVKHRFARSGSVGQWKYELPEKSHALFLDRWGELMARFGYW